MEISNIIATTVLRASSAWAAATCSSGQRAISDLAVVLSNYPLGRLGAGNRNGPPESWQSPPHMQAGA